MGLVKEFSRLVFRYLGVWVFRRFGAWMFFLWAHGTGTPPAKPLAPQIPQYLNTQTPSPYPSSVSNGSSGSEGAYHLKKWFMMNFTVRLLTWKFSRPSSK